MFKLHNNHITSKVILILLAIIMILPILSTLGVSAAASDAPATALTSGEEILIKSDDCDSSVGGTYYPHVIHLSGGSTRYPGIISSSDDIVTSNAYYVNGDGEKVFAFCIDPDKDGVAESGGSYYVTLSEKLTDKFEIAALKLSVRSDINDILYPGLSFANMDYWTSYAVKIAVKFYEMTGQDETKTLAEINNLTPVLSPTGSNMIPNVPDFGSKVIAAIKSAYNWITKNENTAAVTGEEYWIGEPEDDNHQRYVFITYSATPTETTETPTEPTTQPETTQPTTPAAPTTGSLKIGKINGMTGEPVPGTKFLVEQIDGTYSTTVTVGSDGYYIINDIPKGSYKITEVYVPEPLILDTTPKSVYIDPETATEDNPIVVEFVNDQMTCVHVYKYDSKTNEPLNGAQFKLSRKDETSAIYTGITGESQCSSDCGLCKTPCNADGMICFGPLAPGWYTVSEVNPAPGYILDLATSSVQTFEVTGKETQEIQLKFDNKRRPELKIIKKDSDGNHLAGVEFEIWKSGTQEKFSAKTDSNGEIYIPWDNTDYPLDEGAYSIREINVPAGYVLSDEVKEVMLVGNTLSEVVFVDPKKPGLTITKTDNDGNPLDGVTFEIWKSGTDTKHSATTIGGKIVLEWDNADFPLEAGSYSIREVSVTRGYLLDTTVKEALLENGKMVTVPFTNDKRPELEILKTDSAGKPLSGAVFTIKRTGTTTEYELTTDLSGKIVIPYDSPLYPLEPDRYIITEKNAPEHYLASENNSQEVILEPNTRKTVTFVDAEKPKLTIEKYDQRGDGNGNALPLSAVTFRIYKTDGSYDQTLTTGADGKIRITDLLPGEYHINEISTKDGYVLNTEVRTVILKGDDDVTETFYNLKRPELLIVKLDSKTGKPLANAHFQISKDNEVLFQDLVTDASGQILIPYNDKSRLLEEGVYKVTEIAPPPGYDLVLPASQNVVLRNGERTRVEFSDIRKPTLIITKLNALTKKPVPNTLYNIKWENPTGGVHDLGNWYTDKNGQIIFEFAEVGWYQITEIMPAPGMTKAKNPVTRIYLAPGTNAYSDNELRTSDNSSGQNQNTAGPGVNTINNTTTSSSGSGITVIDPFDNIQTIDIPVYNIGDNTNTFTDNQAFTYSEKIDAIPDVTISGVTPDASDPAVDVVFAYDNIDTTETVLSAADEYINPYYSAIQTGGVGNVFTDVSGTSYNLVDNGGVAAFANDAGTIIDFPLNSIIIKKEDATNGNMLAGAVFEIYRMSDETSGQSGTLVARLVTGNSGMLAVIGLEADTYLVKEVRAPANYTLNNQDTQTALLVPDNTSNIEFTFSNYPFGSILVDKTDAVTNKPLAGARFELTKADGAHIAYANTDNYGHAVFTNLEPGAYIVAEQEAPSDYQIDSTPQTVSVPANGEMQTVYFKDQPFGSIIIVKKDAVLKTPISGVRFHVTDIHGANIGDITPGNGFAADGIYTTDGNGEIRIDHIPQGNYLVTEVYAPDPYIIDDTPKTVYAEWGKIKTVEFFNSRTGALVITKYNSVTKEPLADAVFKITDIQGAVVGASDGLYRTDETGTIHIYGLVPGGYKVTEVQAPQGFILDNTVQTIQILDEKMYYLEFFDAPYGSLIIRKVEADTLIPLANAEFSVTKADGTFIGNYRSDANGTVEIDSLAPGFYTVTETKPPENYSLGDNVKTIEVKSATITQVEFQNRPFGSLVIKKVDKITGNPLTGAQFTVYHQGGALVGEYETGADGTVNIPAVEPGYYIITETRAPTGYALDSTGKTIEVKAVVPTVATFTNAPLSGVEIVKTDSINHAPLSGAIFEVNRANGEHIGTYKTDKSGKILVSDLIDGVYVVSEAIAPDGYMRDEIPKNVTVVSGKLATVEFENKPLSGIQIVKTDEFSRIPLANATFEVAKADGEKVGQFKTDSAGKIIVSDLAEGVYVISETIAPYGYVRDESSRTVTVKSGKLETVEFTNRPYSGIEITKYDYFSKIALSGAVFTVERADGLNVGEYTTDETGKVLVTNLIDGVYIVTETTAPQGYFISEQPKTVTVKSGVLTFVKFADNPLSGIEILKVDKYTHLALSDATFEITRANGEKVATVKTDASGKAIVSDLGDGVYIISETIAPSGYEIDSVPQTIEVKSGKLTEVQFEDKPLSTLKILKLNSITREPIAGVEFTISRMNGEKIMNEFGSLTFKTDISGSIYIPLLPEGYYTVTEIKTADGYFLDKEPKTVLVEADKDTVLEVLNTPMSSLLIVKTDTQTGQPLAGVVYDIKQADGTFVAGNIMDVNQPGTQNNSPSKSTSENGDISGSYTTDSNGRIQINGLAAGEYMVVERKALNGYELDTNVYNVTVLPGKQATLQLTNKPKSGIRLTKIDSISKKPIYNVEFMLFDKNNKVVGVYYTDNMGVIDFPNDIPEGRYTIRESRPAPGYSPDDMPRTVEFIAGQVTEIVWENTPQLGQIQILKKSGDDNEQNGLPAGTPLQGATFEIYNYKTGVFVDRIVSGADGRAISTPLPLGRYVVREVQSPKYYILSDKMLDIEIDYPNQIIKQEFLNYSANTGVSVRKTGNVEAMPGDEIRYDIKELRNTSSVPLTDFYFRDIIPTNAARLTKIVTGTFNQSLKYKVMVTTNKGDTRVIADNLSTTKNNVIDCSNAALGLKNDEYVTSFTFIFGTVKAGFSLVEQPQIFVEVLPNLQNGFEFANKCDAGGKYSGEWVISSSVWTVRIYNPATQKLPKTGY